jgi:hypothetical protein
VLARVDREGDGATLARIVGHATFAQTPEEIHTTAPVGAVNKH